MQGLHPQPEYENLEADCCSSRPAMTVQQRHYDCWCRVARAYHLEKCPAIFSPFSGFNLTDMSDVPSG
jgi:hypothetical protein